MDTLRDDIVPIGSFEACPVTVTGNYLEYPGVVKISSLFDYKKLYKEYVNTIPNLENKFLKNLKDILIGTTPEEVKDHLIKLGWEGNNYISYSIRKFGTNELVDAVLPETRKTLSNFGTIFRQQYMCAKPNTRLKPHIDNLNCEVHGFKVHIPINTRYHVFVAKEGIYYRYVLEPGYAYYLNSSLTHFVANPYNETRVNLSFQLASDIMIHNGEEVQPTNKMINHEDENEIYSVL
jgi:hypothetical protein